MLGLILIYFIGKYFYKLAEDFNQNKWLYAILGVLSYYFGASVVGGVIVGVADSFLELGINWDNTLGLSLMIMPFGIGLVYLFYYLLKRKWQKSFVEVKDEIQDIGKSTEGLKD